MKHVVKIKPHKPESIGCMDVPMTK